MIYMSNLREKKKYKIYNEIQQLEQKQRGMTNIQYKL